MYMYMLCIAPSISYFCPYFSTCIIYKATLVLAYCLHSHNYIYMHVHSTYMYMWMVTLILDLLLRYVSCLILVHLIKNSSTIFWWYFYFKPFAILSCSQWGRDIALLQYSTRQLHRYYFHEYQIRGNQNTF